MIDRIDHFVLTVSDIDKICEFYSKVLGMVVVISGNGRKALEFGNQKIKLHKIGTEFELNALNPNLGTGDFCFITNIPLDRVINHIKSKGINIVSEPKERTGATGFIQSFHFRDPDGNIIEIANY